MRVTAVGMRWKVSISAHAPWWLGFLNALCIVKCRASCLGAPSYVKAGHPLLSIEVFEVHQTRMAAQRLQFSVPSLGGGGPGHPADSNRY